MNQQEKWVHDLYEYAASQILKCTIKLYTNEKRRMRPHGCGVLVCFQGSSYMITAAHCIKQKNKLLKLAVLDAEGRLHFIRGPIVLCTGNKDQIDVAVVKLSSKSVTALRDAAYFLDGSRIMHNVGIKEETEYLVAGFPNTQTKINFAKRRISFNPLVHIGKSRSVKSTAKMGFDPKYNLCIHFNRRKSSFWGEKKLTMSPDPIGISGSGLWYIQSYDVASVEDVQFHLCGILIEHHATKTLMLATKTEAIQPLVNKMLFVDPDKLD